MARIIGGTGTSHTPTIGYAVDARKEDDPAWKPVFEAYEPVRRWIGASKPDAAALIYNDHVTSFFFDHYSAFALGVGDEWHPADARNSVGSGRAAVRDSNGSTMLQTRSRVTAGHSEVSG